MTIRILRRLLKLGLFGGAIWAFFHFVPLLWILGGVGATIGLVVVCGLIWCLCMTARAYSLRESDPAASLAICGLLLGRQDYLDQAAAMAHAPLPAVSHERGPAQG